MAVDDVSVLDGKDAGTTAAIPLLSTETYEFLIDAEYMVFDTTTVVYSAIIEYMP